ncbi:hypothetical protein IAU60_003697 [Kwoniella sp. DSM 27419]
MASRAPLPFPLIKAADIEAAMKTDKHYLNEGAKRTEVCMSDKAGMQGLGVWRAKLAPHDESTRIHYHLNDSEWLYILAGTGTLQLIDASLSEVARPTKVMAGIHRPESDHKYDIQEHPVAAGDFMGFQSGIGASKYAHGLKAGPEGLEYIVGGTRERMDVCVYPEVGVSNVFEQRIKWEGEISAEVDAKPKDE